MAQGLMVAICEVAGCQSKKAARVCADCYQRLLQAYNGLLKAKADVVQECHELLDRIKELEKT